MCSSDLVISETERVPFFFPSPAGLTCQHVSRAVDLSLVRKAVSSSVWAVCSDCLRERSTVEAEASGLHDILVCLKCGFQVRSPLSHSQPVSQAARLPVSQAVSQPGCQSARQTVSQDASQPGCQSARMPVSQDARQPGIQSARNTKHGTPDAFVL